MKKLFISLVICISFLISCIGVAYADTSDTPQIIQEVANKSLELVKNKIIKNPVKWGFSKDDNISRIALGKGYRLRYLDMEKLKNSTSNSLLDVTRESDFWQYIVYLNGQPKMYLTVGFEDGEYRMVQMGGKAQDLDNALKNFKKLTGDKGRNVKPIIAKVEGKYLLVLKTDVEELVLPAIPTEKAKTFYNMDYNKFKKSEEVVKLLKEKQEKSTDKIEYGGNGYNSANPLGLQNPSGSNTSTTNLVISAIIICLVIGAISIVFYRRKSCVSSR